MIGLVALSALAAHADQRDEARIDLNGEGDQVQLDVSAISSGGKWVHAAWRKEMAPYQINATFPASEKWEEGSITFVPQSDGKVVLQLAGPNVKKQAVWVAYDDVRVIGAELKNGGFELKNASGAPQNWYRPQNNETEVATLRDKNAFEGTTCAAVWHNSRFTQALQVKKGKPVTVLFRMRLEESR